MIYNHLPSRPFKQSASGVRIHMETLVIPLASGKSKYKLEERSPVEDNYPVAFKTILGDGNKKYDDYTLAQADVFNNAYLTLREGTTDILERIPFEQIWLKVQNGYEEEIRCGRINLSNSFVEIMDIANIQAGTALIIQVYYAVPKEQKSKRI